MQGFLSHDLEETDVSYVEETVMSIASLDALVATVIHCLVEMEKLGGHSQKENPDT